MELANNKFGTELSNNRYYGVVKPPKVGTVGKPSGTTYVTPGGSVGTPVAAPGPAVSKGGPAIVTPPPVVVIAPPLPIYAPPLPTGSGGGSGGGGGSSEEKSADAPAEDKAATEVAKGTELSFFQKPIGKVSVLIALAALLYGGYRVMKSK